MSHYQKWKTSTKIPTADKWTSTKNLFSEDCFDKLWSSENIWWHITLWSLFQTISWFLRTLSHCLNQCSLIVKVVNWHSPRQWWPYLTATSYWLNQCSLIIKEVTWHTPVGKYYNNCLRYDELSYLWKLAYLNNSVSKYPMSKLIEAEWRIYASLI